MLHNSAMNFTIFLKNAIKSLELVNLILFHFLVHFLTKVVNFLDTSIILQVDIRITSCFFVQANFPSVEQQLHILNVLCVRPGMPDEDIVRCLKFSASLIQLEQGHNSDILQLQHEVCKYCLLGRLKEIKMLKIKIIVE